MDASWVRMIQIALAYKTSLKNSLSGTYIHKFWLLTFFSFIDLLASLLSLKPLYFPSSIYCCYLELWLKTWLLLLPLLSSCIVLQVLLLEIIFWVCMGGAWRNRTRGPTKMCFFQSRSYSKLLILQISLTSRVCPFSQLLGRNAAIWKHVNWHFISGQKILTSEFSFSCCSERWK